MDIVKSTFGFNEGETSRKMLFALALQFEQFSGDEMHLLKSETVEMAKKLRDIVVAQCTRLQRSEMLRMYKAINRAKVRALSISGIEGYKVFRMLDSLSGDISRLM